MLHAACSHTVQILAKDFKNTHQASIGIVTRTLRNETARVREDFHQLYDVGQPELVVPGASAEFGVCGQVLVLYSTFSAGACLNITSPKEVFKFSHSFRAATTRSCVRFLPS